MSKCKGCGADIIWIKTPNGSNHPIDAKPQKMWVKGALDMWKLVDAYMTHFSTCPDSKKFSGRGGS